MIVTKKSMPRRLFLRGLGASLALPFLDSMVPALSAGSKPVVRRDGMDTSAPSVPSSQRHNDALLWLHRL